MIKVILKCVSCGAEREAEVPENYGQGYMLACDVCKARYRSLQLVKYLEKVPTTDPSFK
jgi:hypothetical protein